jgi:hypothetical protein
MNDTVIARITKRFEEYKHEKVYIEASYCGFD